MYISHTSYVCWIQICLVLSLHFPLISTQSKHRGTVNLLCALLLFNQSGIIWYSAFHIIIKYIFMSYFLKNCCISHFIILEFIQMDITNKMFPFLCSLSWSILTLKLNFQDFIKDNTEMNIIVCICAKRVKETISRQLT